MLLGFFDDSGKESDLSNRIVCAAGYIASASSIWGGFHELWSNILLLHGLDELHMKEMMCSQSKEQPFCEWQWEKKKAVLEDFTAAIKISHIVGFGVAVDADAWRELPESLTRVEGTAQEFCFMRLIRKIVERVKKSAPNERIAVMFDCDEEFTSSRFKRFLGIRHNRPEDGDYLISFGVGEPKAYLPLQAADFLAWETRTHLLRQMKGHESRPELQHMLMVLPGFFPDYTGEYWDKEQIEKVIKPMADGPSEKRQDL
jgi:hypothetical protein